MTHISRDDDFARRDESERQDNSEQRDSVTDDMRHELQRSGLSPATDPAELHSESPEMIHADIARTRAEMTGTVDAIQERLNPDRLADQAKDAISSVGDHAVRTAKEAMHNVTEHAKDTVRDATIGRAEHAVSNAGETARSFSATMTETVRQNPIPALLAGASIGWLLMKSREVDNHRFTGYRNRGSYAYRPYESYQPGDPYQGYPGYQGYQGYAPGSQGFSPSPTDDKGSFGQFADHTRDTVADTASNMKESVGGMVSSTQDTMNDMTNRAQETMSDMSNRAQEQVQFRTRQVQSEFDQMLRENPLALGAMAFFAGAACALLFPTTRAENAWMGSARDSLMDSARETARETAQDTMQKAQRAIDDAAESAKDEAKDQNWAA
jgi:ElaB/YqjD/DUF883 family membrane-anchored ribosome-binding protein